MEKEGFLYKRPGSKNWFMGYSVDGKKYRMSTGTSHEVDAQRILERRLKKIAEGDNPSLVYERTKFDELARDLLTDYKINGKRSIKRVEQSIAHLKKSFKGTKASKINTAMVKEYIAGRLDEGAAPGTINRELTALKRMFNLAIQSDKLNLKPYIPMLQEDNIREGFLEYEQFLLLRNRLPEYLRPFVTVAYMTGLRRGELVNLERKKVFLSEGYIRLGPLDTKNKKPRTVYLNDEALDAMKIAWKNRRPDCNLVFHNKGRRISDFRKSWNKACKEIGLDGLLFHDLRRSAVRNMVRAGIPERVAMSISGHRTRSVFDRYNIVSEKDLQEAARMLDEHLKHQKQITTSLKSK